MKTTAIDNQPTGQISQGRIKVTLEPQWPLLWKLYGKGAWLYTTCSIHICWWSNDQMSRSPFKKCWCSVCHGVSQELPGVLKSKDRSRFDSNSCRELKRKHHRMIMLYLPTSLKHQYLWRLEKSIHSCHALNTESTYWPIAKSVHEKRWQS